LNAASEEFGNKFPKIIANIAIALIFTGLSQAVGWFLSGFNPDVVFLLQIGLLLAAGMFLVRTLFDALIITDKATKLLLKRVGIKKELSRQRVFKDVICIVAILLVAAAAGPIVTDMSSFGPLAQQIVTYGAMGLILLFVYDIGRVFYKITEKKANRFADRISSSNNGDETDSK
jgi:magnesium-transporting ATPase (P-type)